MANATKTALKVTDKDCMIKVSGPDNSNATITLATDLLLASENLVGESEPPKAIITGVAWTGDGSSKIQILRNNVIIMTLHSQTASQFDFMGQNILPDTVESASNIVVNITGGQGEVYIRLSKIAGYLRKVDTAVTGGL